MPALNLIFRSGSNRVFGCACSLFLAVAIARCGEPSGQTSTNLPAASPPPATKSTCATPAASQSCWRRGIYTQIAIDPESMESAILPGLRSLASAREGQNLPADSAVLAMSPNIVSARVAAVGSGRSSAIRLQIRLSHAGASGRHHVHRRNNSHCSVQGRVFRQRRPSMQ